MGYMKQVEFGDKIEIYDYEKEIHTKAGGKALTTLQKKRRADIRAEEKKRGIERERAKSSVNRAKSNFFRLVHHNNCLADTIHFVTLTFAYEVNYKTATRAVARFFERVKSVFPETKISLSYISVPELTKAGRYHFHILLYNLPTEISFRERETRNLQRQWQRGYINIDLATYTSEGLAGYMAKYMAKNIGYRNNEAVRGYTCSRNVEKISVFGNNALSELSDLVPVDSELDVLKEYDTLHLGRCLYKKYSTNKNYARERRSNGRIKVSSAGSEA